MGLRLLPEGRGIFPDLSVAENIDVVAARNVGAARRCSASPMCTGCFPILEERRPTRAGSLSGGQQQMLALALAILGSPRCLLLDEPSIGLAPNLVERLFQQVRDVCKSHAMTAILVEQNVAAAMKIADRVIIMNNGQDRVRRTAARGAGVEFLELFLDLPSPIGPVREAVPATRCNEKFYHLKKFNRLDR